MFVKICFTLCRVSCYFITRKVGWWWTNTLNPKHPLCGTTGVQMGWQSADMWASGFKKLLHVGLRTVVNCLHWVTLLEMNVKLPKRTLTLSQQVWTDSTVTVQQGYFIPVRKGSEKTSKQHRFTTKKNKKWVSKYTMRFSVTEKFVSCHCGCWKVK